MKDADTTADAEPVTAHDLRDITTTLANALELLRLTCGDRPGAAATLRLADRQVQALCRAADRLQDAAASRPGGDLPCPG